MANPEPKTYNFKFRLVRPNPAFDDKFFEATVDEAIAQDFGKINEKIMELIPWIKKRVYTLTWTDAEGDEINISNDGDLEIALKELAGPNFE